MVFSRDCRDWSELLLTPGFVQLLDGLRQNNSQVHLLENGVPRLRYGSFAAILRDIVLELLSFRPSHNVALGCMNLAMYRTREARSKLGFGGVGFLC